MTFSWLAVLPQLVKLALGLLQLYQSARDRGLGHDQAVAEALAIQAKQVAEANAVRSEAAGEHAAKKDDSAFDPDFQRKD